MTPEGRVKNKIKKVLEKYKGRIYIDMYVPGGYGKPTLDYTGCFHGWYFAIEAKAPGKKPTERQLETIKDMEAAGAKVFVIDGDTTELETWLADVEETWG